MLTWSFVFSRVVAWLSFVVGKVKFARTTGFAVGMVALADRRAVLGGVVPAVAECAKDQGRIRVDVG
ncbi:hypothetical protein YIM_08840 [Amycolatopsis sp. YIM 10]|nr:hypothetical protein YIM_08840 [Amycolatopsis sp. YIM 10]